MKTHALLLAPVLGLALFVSPVRAEEQPATNNLQEVQAIIGQLSKLTEGVKEKNEGAPDFGKMLGELAKLAAIATPAQTKEEQAQESQLIAFVKSLIAMIPQQVNDEDASAADEPVAPAATAAAVTGKPVGLGAIGLQASSNLATGGLMTSSLGGSAGPMTDAEWRARFPVRTTGR